MKKLFLFALSLTIGLLFCLCVGAQTSVTITQSDLINAGSNGSIYKNLDLHGDVVFTCAGQWLSKKFKK